MENFETERLRFREWKESDAEDLFLCASDPDIGERAGWPPHKTLDDSLMVILPQRLPSCKDHETVKTCNWGQSPFTRFLEARSADDEKDVVDYVGYGSQYYCCG